MPSSSILRRLNIWNMELLEFQIPNLSAEQMQNPRIAESMQTLKNIRVYMRSAYVAFSNNLDIIETELRKDANRNERSHQVSDELDRTAKAGLVKSTGDAEDETEKAPE